MSTYRLYFRSGPNIVGRHDFIAGNDQAAVTTADVLCDACSDRCDPFEVWESDRCVLPLTPHSPRSAEVILSSWQENVAAAEEAIQISDWEIARSERLLKRLEELRAASRVRSSSTAFCKHG